MRRVRSSAVSGRLGRFGSAGRRVNAALLDGGFKSGMSSGETSDRDPIGRARDIIEPDRVTELDAPGLPTVLPADANLQLRAHAPTCGNGNLNKAPNPRLVKDLEGVVGKDSPLH